MRKGDRTKAARTPLTPVSDATVDRVPIVGIGASAGGLRALQRVFDNIGADTGMAFVVIVHLDRTHESRMPELIQSHTSMPVLQVTKRVLVERNHTYVIPPDRDLSMEDGHLVVRPRAATAGVHAPIDTFFRTLAETHTVDAVAVVLSGMGSDGAQGLKAVRDRGGITVAQAPGDADFDSMPQSAIATGQVDLVLDAEALGAKLSVLNRTGRLELTDDGESIASSEQSAFSRILTHIRVKTGHDFAGYKRSTVARRVERRMRLAGRDDLESYLRTLRDDPVETRALFHDTLVVVTSFFRDPPAIEALERDVISRLFEGKTNTDGVRVWVAGSATGEETYTLAMLLCEFADTLDDPPPIQIFATDIHDGASAFAREGFYPESIAADISGDRIERFFVREPGGYRVKKFVREMVLFATHNLLKDPPFLHLDLVSCRNVLIYLQRDVQQRVLETFHFALRPNGYLFLGTSESADVAGPSLFSVADKRHHVYQPLPFAHPGPRRITPVGGADRIFSRQETLVARAPTPSFGSLHQQLVEEYGPPSLVVNSAEEVVHLSERAGRFLKRRGGEPTHKLLDMAQGELRLELRRLLRAALRTGQPAEALGVAVELDGVPRRINVSARPLRRGTSDDTAGSNYALILFDEARSTPAPAQMEARKRVSAPARADETEQLRAELETTKRLLGTMAEEHDTTIEALRATNEELQSISEEQRAVAEELETSKEELQSINEELRTLNQEHRTRNEELAQVNADLLNLIDSTSIGTLFLDRQLCIRRYTPTIVQLFNVVPADRGRPLADLTHRLEYAGLLDDARAVLSTLVPTEREIGTTRKRWFTMRITPYRSVDDRIDGVVLTFTDTTERRRAEMEHEELLKTVAEISETKSNFIGVMSHEFRTPLNAILGYADILDVGTAGPVTDEQRAHFERIKSNARHLNLMVDQILSSSRLEMQRPIPTPEPFDAAALAREVAAGIEPLLQTKQLSLKVEIPETPIIVESDPTMVRQILFNLLGNAVRFTDTGSITLRLPPRDEMLVLEVEDSGIGIAPENVSLVFERFWQAEQTGDRRRGGNGLGLMVSRSLAEALGGTINLESALGRGSLFRLSVPARRADLAQ